MKKRLRTITLALGALLTVGGVALAFPEATRKNLVAKFDGTTIGCISRFQGLDHAGTNDPVKMTLTLNTLDVTCSFPRPNFSVGGRSRIGLVKWTGSGFQFCQSSIRVVDTPGLVPGRFQFEEVFDGAPCGAGWYKMISCSEPLQYSIPLPGGSFHGLTSDDCSSVLTWTWTPNAWHPICDSGTCGPEPPN